MLSIPRSLHFMSSGNAFLLNRFLELGLYRRLLGEHDQTHELIPSGDINKGYKLMPGLFPSNELT